jgi:MYXO-CTERM domain-containing protein
MTRYKNSVHARRIFAVILALLVLVVSTTAARANGRFPQAQAIVSPPGDPSTLFLRATFGILISRDAGATWRFLCERALGYDGQWDPPIAATRDGTLWVGREDGLVSTKDGCGVTEVAELRGETIKDLTIDARGETVFAITGAPGKKSNVYRRAPGRPFERLASMDDLNFMTIEIAPSRAARVYVSGQPYGTIRGRLYRSDDGGATLRGDANDLPAEGPFFIGAIDSTDPDRVLVRHLHTTGSDVLLTTDAGRTWKNVLSMKSAMFGFAKSPDRKTYWAGSGLPEDGIFRSSDRGATFEPVTNHGVLCLHAASATTLFVCENPATLGAPAIAVSKDEGRTVVPIVKLTDILGPVACDGADASASAVCTSSWVETRASFVGSANARGTDAGARAASAARAKSSSCGCRVAGERSPPDLGWIMAGLLALAAWLRPRGLRGSDPPQRGAASSTQAARNELRLRIFPRTSARGRAFRGS